MSIKDVMDRKVVTVTADTPISEVARQMMEQDVGFISVVDGDRLIGTITDRDLALRGLVDGRDPARTPVRDLMSLEIVCCFEDQEVADAEALFAEYEVRRLPVMNRDHKLVGILSQRDLAGMSCGAKATKVTFYKEKTDSYGRPHNVPLRTVYITGAKRRENAETKAVEELEHEEKASWKNVATGYEVEEPGGKTTTKTSRD